MPIAASTGICEALGLWDNEKTWHMGQGDSTAAEHNTRMLRLLWLARAQMPWRREAHIQTWGMAILGVSMAVCKGEATGKGEDVTHASDMMKVGVTLTDTSWGTKNLCGC